MNVIRYCSRRRIPCAHSTAYFGSLKSSIEPPVDGVLGYVQTQLMTKSPKKQNQPVIQIVTNPKTISTPIASTEVNVIQSSEYSGTKKKGKNKSKKYENQQESNKTQNPNVESKNKRKVKFSCLICGGDHFTKECPWRVEVIIFLKKYPTSVLILSLPNNNWLTINPCTSLPRLLLMRLK